MTMSSSVEGMKQRVALQWYDDYISYLVASIPGKNCSIIVLMFCTIENDLVSGQD